MYGTHPDSRFPNVDKYKTVLPANLKPIIDRPRFGKGNTLYQYLYFSSQERGGEPLEPIFDDDVVKSITIKPDGKKFLARPISFNVKFTPPNQKDNDGKTSRLPSDYFELDPKPSKNGNVQLTLSPKEGSPTDCRSTINVSLTELGRKNNNLRRKLLYEGGTIELVPIDEANVRSIEKQTVAFKLNLGQWQLETPKLVRLFPDPDWQARADFSVTLRAKQTPKAPWHPHVS